MDIEYIIREYISGVLHLSLATAANNMPWVSEVHFAYDDSLTLYFRSLPTRRHSQEIANNPRVAGNIVRQHMPNDPPIGVYFEGTAQQLITSEERQHAYKCIRERFKPKPDILAEAADPAGHQFYAIAVETYYVFGAFGGMPTQKYALRWANTQ